MPRLPLALRPWWSTFKAAYTRTTRVVAPASARLARLTDHGGPRGIARTVEDAIATGGPQARMWVVREAEEITRPMPRGEPAGDQRFVAARSARVPRVAVAVLPGGRVDARFGAVLTSDHRLVDELSQYFGISGATEHPQFLRPFRRAPQEHAGTVAVLADRGDDNYYHFLFDVLPKLDLLRDCPGLPEIDAYYAPLSRGYQRELLEAAGLPLDRVIDSRTVPYLRARRLVVPGLPDAHLRHPGWVVSWLRATLLPEAPSGPTRRLYLTRGAVRSSRVVRNEEEVLEALRPLDFEVFDAGAHSVAEQIDAFSAAEMIVAPHGAALANLVFTTQPVTVVEIFPPDYVNVCYWALASRMDWIDYRYVLGRGPVPPGDPQHIVSDIEVDVERLIRVLGT